MARHQQRLSDQATAEEPAARLDELQSKEAALEIKFNTAQTEIAGFEQRLAAPLPSDTVETLAGIDDRLRRARAPFAITKRDFEAATAARIALEIEIQLAAEHRRRQDLEARVDELVRRVPTAYRRLAEELLALVTSVHDADQEVAKFNKTRAADAERIQTFHDRVRVTPATAEHRAILPIALSSIFEIPALQYGDRDYRVAGARRPRPGTWGEVWKDVNGVERHG